MLVEEVVLIKHVLKILFFLIVVGLRSDTNRKRSTRVAHLVMETIII